LKTLTFIKSQRPGVKGGREYFLETNPQFRVCARGLECAIGLEGHCIETGSKIEVEIAGVYLTKDRVKLV
jgi:hypothetical protein